MKKAKKNKDLHYRNNSSFSLYKSQSSRSFIHQPKHSLPNDNIGRFYTETDNFDRTCLTPLPEHSKRCPISLAVLQKYFSDICSSLNQKNSVSIQLLSKLKTMKDVLKDCYNSIPDLSLDIYLQMASAFQDLDQIQSQQSPTPVPVLINKCLQIALLIETESFRSKSDPASKISVKLEEPEPTLNLEIELDSRVAKVTVRVLNLWKKIVTITKESGVICCCFLLLYCEIDRTIRVSPYFKVKFDRAINLVKDYCSNPGYVVTVVRKTRNYIERGLISQEIFNRIHRSLLKIEGREVRNMDKTMTGFILYELVLYALRYYNYYNKIKNDIELPDGKISPFKSQDSINHDSSFSGLHFESFPTNFSLLSATSPFKSHSPVQGRIKSIKAPILYEKTFYPTKAINKSSLNLRDKSPDKIGFIHRRTNSPLKLSPKKSIDCRISETMRKSPIKAGILKFQRESLSTTSSSPSRLLTAKFVSLVEKPKNDRYRDYIKEFFLNFIKKKVSMGCADEVLARSKTIEQLILHNREGWVKEFEQRVGIIRQNAIRKLEEENKILDEINKAKKQIGSYPDAPLEDTCANLGNQK